MSAMDATMDAALQGWNPTIFGAIEIVMPSYTLRLLSGAGVLTFDGKTFTGSDNTFGVIESIDDITDGQGNQTPSLSMTLIPASTATAANLAAPNMQNSPVSIWLGVVDPASGLVVGEPLLVFAGTADVPMLTVDNNQYTLELEISSVFEAFFLTDDGVALSDTFHQMLWPGETGLADATGVLRMIYWGQSPTSGVTK